MLNCISNLSDNEQYLLLAPKNQRASASFLTHDFSVMFNVKIMGNPTETKMEKARLRMHWQGTITQEQTNIG